MTKDEVNRTIHEARGLCWHKWEQVGPHHYQCTICNIRCGENSTPSMPNYSSRVGFWDAWNWAKEQEWWLDFVRTYQPYGHEIVLNLLDLPNPTTFAPILAEFVKEQDNA